MSTATTTQTAYAADLAELVARNADYSVSRTGAGGHEITVFSPWGTLSHTHYRADGSRYAPRVCGCYISHRDHGCGY